MLKGRILICDDEESVLDSLEIILSSDGNYQIKTFKTGESALKALRGNKFDVALLDLHLDDIDGLSVFRQMRREGVATETVFITGDSSVDTAVEAMKLGAYDYCIKPVKGADLTRIVAHACEKAALARKNADLENRLESLTRYQDLIGKSEVMQDLFRTLEAVAGSDASVLITGDSGTGKELVANAVHNRSVRKKAPFVAVNCAALPANIFESELFGHEKGAFTGAAKDKAGYFEQADGGTLFLDELTEMPIDLQAKLLRALETRTFRRVGGSKDLTVDVRVLAATNRNPQEAVEQQRLREDVYYRLAVIEIDLPSLNERSEDIPLIADSFLKKFAKSQDKMQLRFSQDTLTLMLNYDWPGNVRELRNAVERAVILSRGEEIFPHDLPPRVRKESAGGSLPGMSNQEIENSVVAPIGTTVGEMERQLILRTLADCSNNKTRAAQVLGVSLKTLHNKLGKYAKEGLS